MTKNKIKSAGTKLMLVGAVLAALGLAYLTLTPKTYHASARIKVEKRDWVHDQALPQSQNPYNPEIAPAECQVLRSNTFFDGVIKKLNLNHQWAQRNHESELSLEEARARLRAKTDIHPMADSSIIVVDVTSDDPAEPAKIANEFTRLYLEFLQSRRQDVIRHKIDSLDKRWQAQNQKVQEAQAKLDQIALQIYRARSTNDTTIYDAESYSLLKTKRAELQTQTAQLRDQLKELKATPPSELPQVLSSIDTETNSMLNTLLFKLRKTKKDLILADPNSPESRHAQASIDDLQIKAAQEANAIVSMKETDLTGRMAALEAFDEKLKHARPASAVDTNLLQNSGYTAARDELQKLRKERDDLQNNMDATYADDVMPVVVTAELMDQADTPARPFSPNPSVVLGTTASGGLLCLAGLGLFFLSQRKPKSTDRK